MNEPIWKLLPLTFMQTTQVVSRTWPDGRQESCLVTAAEYLRWLDAGNTPLPSDSVASGSVDELTTNQGA